MYKWEKPNQSRDRYKHEYDPKNQTFSSSRLNQINKSHKTHPKTEQEEKNRGGAIREEKMSSLRRACFVEKWMEKKVSEKIISSSRIPKSASSKRTTLLDEFDVQDTLFFSTSSETEYSVFLHSRSNPETPCYKPPSIPKPVRTRDTKSRYLDHLDQTLEIESRYLDQFHENKDGVFIKQRSRAQKIYSNFKNLKQPISPGARLSSFISNLFMKESKRERNSSTKKECKSEQASTCSSASSFSRSCLSKNSSPSSCRRKFQDGIKRTVRFCPVSVIVDEDSRPCGHKSLFKEDGRSRMSTKVARSISKRYEELKKLNEKKQLEEVALDLLNDYWDAELSRSHHSQSIKEKVNDDDDYSGDNHGVNYDQDEDDDDGLSCSSSDLFELDHLSLIGDELPVYETTRFDPKIL